MNNKLGDKELERIIKALANKRRLAMLRHLKYKKEKEATVGDISETVRLSFKSTSRHLSILFAADILEKEQRVLAVYYRIAGKLPEPARRIITLL